MKGGKLFKRGQIFQQGALIKEIQYMEKQDQRYSDSKAQNC